MAEIFHLNCVRIKSPFRENVCGHCLLIREGDRLMLVDTGIGMEDTHRPNERIGEELVKLVGYQFDEQLTAIRQIEALGFDPAQVTDCIISHLDNDHIGGLPDFPRATVHLSQEEYNSFLSGHPRYLSLPLAHQPVIKTYKGSQANWQGLELRKVDTDSRVEIFLVPLWGHTEGHCGVLIRNEMEIILYAGDAYYLRAELEDPDHPVSQLATIRAVNNEHRLNSLEKIRQFHRMNPAVVLFGYHDIDEFPG